MNQNLSFIFVHGLSGWGSYDKTYKRMPYWGMRGGDLMVFLREKGFNCYAASVSPTGSAWDRACELYAQLAGKKSDYGEVHSRSYGHARFGLDFTDKNSITPGIWNVFPAYKGDHMALQGGLRYTHDIRRFYLTLLRMISRL